MKARALVLLIVVIAIPLFVLRGRSGAAHDTPAVFTKASYEQARAELTQDRVLIVDATASWCPPCQEMKATTWRDPKVEAWFAASGTAFMLDVDEEAAIAKALAIEAMPTLIALRSSNGMISEAARHVGFMDADELVAWLDEVKKGAAK